MLIIFGLVFLGDLVKIYLNFISTLPNVFSPFHILVYPKIALICHTSQLLSPKQLYDLSNNICTTVQYKNVLLVLEMMIVFKCAIKNEWHKAIQILI